MWLFEHEKKEISGKLEQNICVRRYFMNCRNYHVEMLINSSIELITTDAHLNLVRKYLAKNL